MSDLPGGPRRALSGLRGGEIALRGDRAVAELLAGALDVVDGDDHPADLTHGFHSYPARFHPELPRRLLEARPRARRVLDPFVGSGTTLIEAAVAGRHGHGVDINPLAIMLARFKSTPASAARRRRLALAAGEVAAASHEAVRAARRRSTPRPAATARTRYDDPRHYPPHVFRELVGLRGAIDAVAPEAAGADPGGDAAWLREALLLTLSSIVVKVSLQRSDTDETIVERAIARGAATRHFARRAEELVARLEAYAAAVPPSTPAPDVRLGDARRLGHIADESIDLVLTSPPYLGTYDYATHHARRFGWLGLDARALARDEIGARSKTRDEAAALRRWSEDVAAFVAEIARVLAPGGEAFVLVGDSAVGSRAVAGDEELRRAASAARLEVVASASQARPEVYGPARGQLGEGKREHLIALARG